MSGVEHDDRSHNWRIAYPLFLAAMAVIGLANFRAAEVARLARQDGLSSCMPTLRRPRSKEERGPPARLVGALTSRRVIA